MPKIMKNTWEHSVCGNFIKLHIKEEFYTLIDTESLEKIIALNKTWGLSKTGNGRYYIHAFIDGRKRTLHRFLMGYPDGLIDHMNHNSLDNRLSNLRLATRSQNNANKGKRRSDNTSGVTGVYFDKKVKKFKARIWINGKSKWVGQFDSIEEADSAMKKARDRYYGGFGNGVL
jgi:hypothetical protein